MYSKAYRHGIVSEIDPARGRARVQFQDYDGMFSYWLQVLKRNTGRDKSYSMPDVGEYVVCLLDDRAEEGCILGAVYSAPEPPPVDTEDKTHTTFADGTVIEYDRADHKLYINNVGEIEIIAVGPVKITTQAAAQITAEAEATLHSAERVAIAAPLIEMDGVLTLRAGSSGWDATISAQRRIALSSGTEVTVQSPQVTVQAPQVNFS